MQNGVVVTQECWRPRRLWERWRPRRLENEVSMKRRFRRSHWLYHSPMKCQRRAVTLSSLAFHGLGRIGVRPALGSESLEALH